MGRIMVRCPEKRPTGASVRRAIVIQDFDGSPAMLWRREVRSGEQPRTVIELGDAAGNDTTSATYFFSIEATLVYPGLASVVAVPKIQVPRSRKLIAAARHVHDQQQLTIFHALQSRAIPPQ